MPFISPAKQKEKLKQQDGLPCKCCGVMEAPGWTTRGAHTQGGRPVWEHREMALLLLCAPDSRRVQSELLCHGPP